MSSNKKITEFLLDETKRSMCRFNGKDIFFVQPAPGQREKKLFYAEGAEAALDEVVCTPLIRGSKPFSYTRYSAANRLVKMDFFALAERFSKEEVSIWANSHFASEYAELIREGYIISKRKLEKLEHQYPSAKVSKTEKQTKREVNMLDKIVETNKNAAKTAAVLTATKGVNDVVIAKVAQFLPENIRPMANTPLGKLVLANVAAMAVDMAGDTLDRKTKTLAAKVTEGMTVNAMTEVMELLDLPGIIKHIVTAPELAQFVVDDTEKAGAGAGVVGEVTDKDPRYMR